MSSSKNDPKSLLSIHLAEPGDIAALYAISLCAFQTDTHTLFKLHEKGLRPDELAHEMPNELPGLFEQDGRAAGETKGLLLKAVRQNTGEIVGMSGWRWWNRYGEKGTIADHTTDASFLETLRSAPIDLPTAPPGSSALSRLSAQTSAHLFTLHDRFCDPSTRGLYCTGIAVLPDAQRLGLGVGTALIREAAQIADREHAEMWVHLSDSEAGQRAFEKNRFRLWSGVGLNEVDLDEYAEKGMPEGREGTRWGKYCFRCLLRDAR